MKRAALPLLIGVLVVGLGMYLLVASIGSPPDDDSFAESVGDTGDPAPLARAMIEQHPEDEELIERFLAHRADGQDLVRRYGVQAPLAYDLLGDAGIDLLVSGSAPNFLFYIESPTVSAAALTPVLAYLEDLAVRDPRKADDLFYLFNRMDGEAMDVLAELPHALPVLAVVPETGAKVLKRYGEPGLEMMLRFTPDSYPVIASLLETDGDRVFSVYDTITAERPDLAGAGSHRVLSFLGLYFLEFGEVTEFLESHLSDGTPQSGVPQAVYILSRNIDYLYAVMQEHGADPVKALLRSAMDYAESPNPANREIANTVFGVPGTLPYFVETSHMVGERDRVIGEYGRNGGLSMLTLGYPRDLWPVLTRAVAQQGDAALVTLSVLQDVAVQKDEDDPDDAENLVDLFRRFLADDRADLVLDTLQALARALEDDGGPASGILDMVTRTFRQVRDDHWESVPDDYLSRQVSWVWDVLPGRDAFRLARLVIQGYTPTLGETVSGAWDAYNVVTFVYNVGGSVVDATQAVQAALGEESFASLAEALGTIGRDTVSNVIPRLIESISHPRNYLRLALTAGYFAYDAFLRYAPFDIPNEARLLEINREYITPVMWGMLKDVLIEVGSAIIWRPEFDHTNTDEVLPAPAAPNDLDNLDSAARIRLALDQLSYDVKREVMDLLDRNERRRQFTRMLGLVPSLTDDRDGTEEATPPRHETEQPQQDGAEPMVPAPEESEAIGIWERPGSAAAAILPGNERVDLKGDRIRSLRPGEGLTTRTSRRLLNIPEGLDAEGWDALLESEAFLSYTLDSMLDMVEHR